MTRDEFKAQLPPVTNDELPIKPPFSLDGVSVRVFPLRASLDALQQLCDGYLNFIPPEAGRFRAFVPQVYLMLLDYGQIVDNNVGWFSQMEVFFSVQVEWHKLVNGRFVFHDWAVITPYIFVDDNLSLQLGRTVYGFPKVLSKVSAVPSQWINDPLGAITLAHVQTKVFPQAYAGRRLELRTFLKVERHSPMSNFRVPPNFADPLMPWTMATEFARSASGAWRDAMLIAQSMRGSELSPLRDPVSTMQQMTNRLADYASPFGKGFVQNSINLKQFRRASAPQCVSYQAVTNGALVTTSFNGGGLLGEDRVMLGDWSGGYTIKLSDYSSLPIARILGLELHHTSPGEGSVAALKPVLPYWMNIDLRYDEGQVLAWRSHDGIWKRDTGEQFDPEAKPAPYEQAPSFNSTVASGVEAVSGPFQFRGTTIRVAPLLASRETLQQFVDKNFNSAFDAPIRRTDGQGNEQVRFTVWSRPPVSLGGMPGVNATPEVGGDTAFVYLTTSSFESVTSKTNNVGDWAKFEMSFMIPVKWERMGKDGQWELAGVGMVPACYMVDDAVAAVSRMEIQGIPAGTADFERPETVWLGDEDSTPNRAQQTLLRVQAEVFEALGVGQKTASRPVVEILSGVRNAGLGESRDESALWSQQLREEQETKKAIKAGRPGAFKTARALALELLGSRTPFSIYTLKQFRDVMDPNKACFQSLVRIPRLLREVTNIEEIEETLVVRIHDYPSLCIKEMLGLYAIKVPGDEGGGLVHDARAIRPFFIRGVIEDLLGQTLMSRCGGPEWTLDPETSFNTLLSDEGSAEIAADGRAETLQDQMNPARMAEIMYQAEAQLEIRKTSGIPKRIARAALKRVDPQMVIDAALSREWGRSSETSRWQRGRAFLAASAGALPVASATKALVETALFCAINNNLAERSGAVASTIQNDSKSFQMAMTIGAESIAPGLNTAAVRWRAALAAILMSQASFTTAQGQMEDNVAILAAADLVYGYVSTEKAEAAAKSLIEALTQIRGLSIEGQPSETNDLDVRVAGDRLRLFELLAEARALSAGASQNAGSLNYGADYREMVDLARKRCNYQLEALLNKLARAYQKPDFCIRRDSVGFNCDALLPKSLSWDEDWYYGDVLNVQPLGLLEDLDEHQLAAALEPKA